MKKSIVILLATIVLMSGCVQQAPADLLQVPQLGIEDEALVKAVQQTLPSHAKLSLPYREKSTNAIRRVDLDGDGIKEAIVTYKNEYDKERILLMRQSEGSWRKWMTLDISYYKFYWMDIVSLSDENTQELLIGYHSYDSESPMVDIYKFSDPKLLQTNGEPPEPAASLSYSWVDTGDVNGDGNTELLIIKHNEQDMKAAVHVYRMEEDQLQELASKEIDGEVNAYYESEIGKVSENRNGFLLEASVGAYSSISSMFVWEEEEVKQIYPKEGVPYLHGRRPLYNDLNEDGILEIVELIEAPGQDPDTARIATLFLDRHLQWNGSGRFDPVALKYSDYQYGYSFLIPEKWGESFTVSTPEPEGTGIAAFEFYDSVSGSRAELFTIYAVSYESWKETEQGWSDRQEKYVVLRTAAGFVYAAVINSEPTKWKEEEKKMFERMQLSVEELKKHFIVLNPID